MTETLTKCVDYLKSEGSQTLAEEEDCFAFKYREEMYIIENDAEDEMFLRFILPNFYDINGEGEEIKALKIINRILDEEKVIKLSLDSEKGMWGTIDLLVDKNTFLPPIIERCLTILKYYCSLFIYEMEH